MIDFYNEIASTRRKFPWPWVLRSEIEFLIEDIAKGDGWRWNEFSNKTILMKDGITVWVDFCMGRVRDPENIPLTTREWWELRKVLRSVEWVPLEKKDAFAELMKKLEVKGGR